MSTPDAITTALYGAFGLEPPRQVPVPAPPERFPAIFARSAPAPSLNPLRLAVGGTVSTTPKR